MRISDLSSDVCSSDLIVTGILLALARISGETAPLLFTAFGNQYWSADVTGPMASVPVVMYQFAGSPYTSWQEIAFAGALVLTGFVLLLSLVARAIVSRTRVSHDWDGLPPRRRIPLPFPSGTATERRIQIGGAQLMEREGLL